MSEDQNNLFLNFLTTKSFKLTSTPEGSDTYSCLIFISTNFIFDYTVPLQIQLHRSGIMHLIVGIL